jgi:CHASE2 domain-containing sensor protein
MNRDQRTQMRWKSMLGVVLFAAGIIGAIAFAVTGSFPVIGAAVGSLVSGVVLLYQVGKSLP